MVGRDADLQRKVTISPIGKPANLTVLRAGKEMTLAVTPIEIKEDAAAPATDSKPKTVAPEYKVVPTQDSLGIHLLPLDDETRTKFRVAASVKRRCRCGRC